MTFDEWLKNGEASELELTAREIQVARLAWTCAKIDANNGFIEKAQKIIAPLTT